MLVAGAVLGDLLARCSRSRRARRRSTVRTLVKTPFGSRLAAGVRPRLGLDALTRVSFALLPDRPHLVFAERIAAAVLDSFGEGMEIEASCSTRFMRQSACGGENLAVRSLASSRIKGAILLAMSESARRQA